MKEVEAEPAVVTTQSQQKFPWGWVWGGCLTVFLLILGGMVAAGAGTFWFYKKQVVRYTSEAARELPVAEVSSEELKQIEQRVESFQEQVETGQAPEQLILTADDINALISQDRKLRGHVFVTLEDGQLEAEVSIPTDALPGAKGRFFNGTVTVDAVLENGVLVVTLQTAEVNGEPVPEAVMTAIRRENLAKNIDRDPEVAAALRRFDSLVIEGNQIILTPKSAAELEAMEPETEDGVATAEAVVDAAFLGTVSEGGGMPPAVVPASGEIEADAESSVSQDEVPPPATHGSRTSSTSNRTRTTPFNAALRALLSGGERRATLN